MSIRLSIDGTDVEVPEGTTIWQAAKDAQIEIPTLCHDESLSPVGVCRICSVEVEGSRTLVASCVREVESGLDPLDHHRSARGVERIDVAQSPPDIPGRGRDGR